MLVFIHFLALVLHLASKQG